MALWSARSKRAPTRIRTCRGGSRGTCKTPFSHRGSSGGLHDRMGGAHRGGGVGAGVGPVVRRRAPRRPLRNDTPPSRSGVGAGHPAETHHGSAGRDLTTRGTRRRGNGCRRPRGRKRDGLGTCPHSSGRPSRPASSFTPPTCSGPRRYARGDTLRPPSGGNPQRTGPPNSPWRTSKRGAGIRRRPVPAGRHPGALTPHAPHRYRSRAAPGAGRAAKGCEWGGGRSRTAPYWPSSTGTQRTGANGTR